MAVSRRLRYEILRRDNNTCQYCGQSAPDVKLTVDHVTPKALGGSDEPSNLLTACADCNSGKSSTNPDAPLVAEADQRAARMAQALELAIAQRQAEIAAERDRIAAFDKAWRNWSDLPRDPGWKSSISRFMALGLDDQFLVDAVDIAMGNRSIPSAQVWKYFCGICWTEAKSIQRRAKELMDDGGDPATPTARPRGLPVEFDQLNVAEHFLPGVVTLFLLGADEDLIERVSGVITEAYWAGMSTSYVAFASTPSDLVASDRQDVLKALVDASMPKMNEARALVLKELGLDGEE